MKFVDLFAGIGGFHYALKQLEKDSRPVMVSEIDKHAIEAYKHNHKYRGEVKNIREYTGDDKFSKDMMQTLVNENYDILFGGFPCQTFSSAGKKLGFLDEVKGTLFFDVAKILKETKPKYVLLENVKHLAKHDGGKTWITIRETLRKIGYKVPEQPILLSPHQFGIPQIRWRVFIPAILSDDVSNDQMQFNFEEGFVEKVRKMKFDKLLDETTIIEDKKILDALDAWGEFIENVKRPYDRTLPVIWLDYMTDKKIDKDGMSPWRIKYITDMQQVYLENKDFIDEWMVRHSVHKWQKRERKLEWQAGKTNFDYKNSYVQLRQSGFRFKTPDIFPTLVAMVQTSLFFDETINKWRYLSKNEVRTLQSFPSSFKYNVPEYQTFKQFGNSVNVDVVKRVLKKLLEVENA